MRILSLETSPAAEILHQAADERGRPEVRRLPVCFGTAEGLPTDVDAVVLTSDLQGVAPNPAYGGEVSLLGEVLADVVAAAVDARIPGATFGVVLAGDLHSAADAAERGASGDPSPVWSAFASVASWVVGVRGNHDLQTSAFAALLRRNARCTVLDGTTTSRGGVRFGGVSLVAGDVRKVGRRTEEEQASLVEAALADRPDVLVLHEGPPGAMPRTQKGSAFLRPLLAAAPPRLVVCGHAHWGEPLAEADGGQVVNVDGRAVVLVGVGRV